MKKLLMKFADGMLTKEQMGKVRGGCGDGGGYFNFACQCNGSGYSFGGSAMSNSDLSWFASYYCNGGTASCTKWS